MTATTTRAGAFAWEDPPDATWTRDAYETKWFPPQYRARLDANPGRWGRIATDAGNHVHPELRRRYPDYEIVARRTDTGTGPRRYTVYARRKANS